MNKIKNLNLDQSQEGSKRKKIIKIGIRVEFDAFYTFELIPISEEI